MRQDLYRSGPSAAWSVLRFLAPLCSRGWLLAKTLNWSTPHAELDLTDQAAVRDFIGDSSCLMW